jgi:hypothetical protein
MSEFRSQAVWERAGIKKGGLHVAKTTAALCGVS